MSRILLLLFIGFLVYLVFRGLTKPRMKRGDPRDAAATTKGEDMVSCARCGVNLPRSEAREEAGRLVCDNNPQCR